MTRWSRRDLLAVGGALILAPPAWAAGDRVPALGLRRGPVSLDVVRSLPFSGASQYVAGDTLIDGAVGWALVERTGISAAFKAGIPSGKGLCSPILALQNGDRSVYIQVPNAADSAWTLGYEDRVHLVHETWLGFLLWEDSCDFYVDADTLPNQVCDCSPLCQVMGSHQRFRTLGGQVRTLFKPTPGWRASHGRRAVRRHERKRDPWAGCELNIREVCTK